MLYKSCTPGTLNIKMSYQFSSGFKKYFANTSWLMLERILRMGMALLVGVYVARYLGPEQFGLLAYIVSLVGIFAAFEALGLEVIVVKYLVLSEGIRDKLLGTSFILKLLGAIVALILVLVISIVLGNSEQLFIIGIVACSFIFYPFKIIDFYFQAIVASKYIVFASSFQIISSALLKIVGVLLQLNLNYFACIIFYDAVALSICFVIVYTKQGLRIIEWRYCSNLAVKLIKEAWPLALSGMAVLTYMRIDQVMIKEMLGEEQAGYYAASVLISSGFYFIPVLISGSVFPAILKYKKAGDNIYQIKLQNLFDLNVWLAIFVASPIYIFSESIISLLFGEPFVAAAPILGIHIWSCVFVFIGVVSGKWLVAENLQIFTFYRALTGAILNIVLNIVLIPYWGIVGAALATLVTYLVSFYLMMLPFKKTRLVFYMATKSLIFPLYWIKRIS